MNKGNSHPSPPFMSPNTQYWGQAENLQNVCLNQWIIEDTRSHKFVLFFKIEHLKFFNRSLLGKISECFCLHFQDSMSFFFPTQLSGFYKKDVFSKVKLFLPILILELKPFKNLGLGLYLPCLRIECKYNLLKIYIS